jgi:hypothetical protein
VIIRTTGMYLAKYFINYSVFKVKLPHIKAYMIKMVLQKIRPISPASITDENSLRRTEK